MASYAEMLIESARKDFNNILRKMAFLSEHADILNEEAEEEVTDVIDNAVDDDTDFDDLSMANFDVKDSDVSDDPDKLTYDPDSYTDDYLGDDKLDGTVDVDIQGTTEESTIFSDMLW